MDEIVQEIREAILRELDFSRELSDEEMKKEIMQHIPHFLKGKNYSVKERVHLQQQVFNSLRKLDILQELVEDAKVTEIMVNGPNNIFYEKEGRIHRFEGCFSSEERLQDIVQQIVARHNRSVNLASPIVDTRLADGSRVNCVLCPISVDGTTLTIRKFPEKPLTMQELIEIGSISKECATLLRGLVEAKYSILISGGTGSGKTTFLNALSQYIPFEERVITIEDAAELQILEVPNLVRLETRNSTTQGVEPILIRDLIKSALRMRPDRIIVGECRGQEAFDMLQAMNTGHDGSLSTVHANSSRDALARLEMMVLMGMELPLTAVQRQIASGIDVIVHLGRLSDKSRRVLEIVEVVGMEEGEIRLNPLYEFQELKRKEGKIIGQHKKVGQLFGTEKLKMYGKG